MERIVSKGDDFVVDVLFYFKPVWRFEFRGDMFSFGVLVIARAREFCNGDELFVFAVSLLRVNCNNII